MQFEMSMLVDCLNQENTPNGVIEYVKSKIKAQQKYPNPSQISDEQIVNDISIAISFFGEKRVVEEVVYREIKSEIEVKLLLNKIFLFDS